MITYHKTLAVTGAHQVCFHDITAEARQAVEASGVRDGLLVVYSQHTTCSVMIQEESHDATGDGTKFLFRDLLGLLERFAPEYRRTQPQYLHPGPMHLAHATHALGEEAAWSRNTDAHLRSCLFGRSETIPIVNGELQLGEFGQIFFVDFDIVRARRRTVRLHVQGNGTR